jgi:hypothetical protein
MRLDGQNDTWDTTSLMYLLTRVVNLHSAILSVLSFKNTLVSIFFFSPSFISAS